METYFIKKRILVVDDQPTNIKVLGNCLMDDYTIQVAINGEDALKIVNGDNPPDLILLDIMMPGMNGYEVCRILKKDRKTCNIPIIFVTAMNEDCDEEMGLKLGAVDYIAKPANPAIIRARVKTHIELKEHRDKLEAMVEKRTGELMETLAVLQAKKEAELSQAAKIHSGRLAALGEMATAMAHEINQPLNAISLVVQGWKMLQKRDLLTSEKMFGDINVVQRSIERIAKLIDHVRTLGHSDGKIVDVDLHEVLNNALSLCRLQFVNKDIELILDIPDNVPLVRAVSTEIEQVVLNVLNNARQAVEDYRQNSGQEEYLPRAEISVGFDEKNVTLAIKDNGGGVPPEITESIFDPFYTTKPQGRGTGLGLSISSQIMAKFNGELTLDNYPGKGAIFIVTMPVKKD
jgi:C4-dicarboxylate-specific signal transduction histidine kinase